jgi:hypothetical protein
MGGQALEDFISFMLFVGESQQNRGRLILRRTRDSIGTRNYLLAQ